jgi:hypothetical protein
MECSFYPVHMYFNIHLIIAYGKTCMLIEIRKISRNQMSQWWNVLIIIIINRSSSSSSSSSSRH